MVAAGMNESSINDIAGWSPNSNMIRRYTAAARTELAHDEYHRLFSNSQ